MPTQTKQQRPDILSFSLDDRFRRLDSVSEAQGHLMERVLFETRHQAAEVQRLVAEVQAHPGQVSYRLGAREVAWMVAISVVTSVITSCLFLLLVSLWR